MDRRDFLALAGHAAVLAALGGCGGDDAAGPDAAGPTFAVANDDDSGHQHGFTLPCADLAGDGARSYATDGVDHAHTVTLSAAELAAIGAGDTVALTFTDGHEHRFAITRPDGVC